ncbi:MAG TPA: CRISPR system precrRNA processing endoribonuclease RAMP protein Cas6 [Chloroflexota bacterium]|nr:CRISPR system precrRNA processing endoribonuclease RAMP protein Cas6 [Chloroflexota bacterium]
MSVDLSIHHLRCTVEAVSPILLPAESGSAIRGALVNALRQHYCPDATLRLSKGGPEADAMHRAMCPVCSLIADEDAEATRGRNIPRPYTIEPPTPRSGRVEPGQQISFGVSLIGTAINLFPYLVLAVPEMGRLGMGQYDSRQGGRGRFTLRSVEAINPLTGARQPLLAGGTHLQLPAIPVTSTEVNEAAAKLSKIANEAGSTVGIDFLSPTRIVSGAQLVRQPVFEPMFQRLLERIDGLAQYYGTPTDEPTRRDQLLADARQVEIVEARTTWVEVMSGSKRLGRSTPVSGYEGRVVFRGGAWDALLPWLLWGQSIHVGKSAVKGNGWYSIDGCPGWGGDGSRVLPGELKPNVGRTFGDSLGSKNGE